MVVYIFYLYFYVIKRVFYLFSGVRADNVTPTSFTVFWDPVPCVKRGDTIEYLLQSQDVARQQDFEKVFYLLSILVSLVFSFPMDKIRELRFLVCLVRLCSL